jgi:hypothetical protein
VTWNVHRTVLERLRTREWRLVGMLIDDIDPLTTKTNVGQQRARRNGAGIRTTATSQMMNEHGSTFVAYLSGWRGLFARRG